MGYFLTLLDKIKAILFNLLWIMAFALFVYWLYGRCNPAVNPPTVVKIDSSYIKLVEHYKAYADSVDYMNQTRSLEIDSLKRVNQTLSRSVSHIAISNARLGAEVEMAKKRGDTTRYILAADSLSYLVQQQQDTILSYIVFAEGLQKICDTLVETNKALTYRFNVYHVAFKEIIDSLAKVTNAQDLTIEQLKKNAHKKWAVVPGIGIGYNIVGKPQIIAGVSVGFELFRFN